MCNQGKIYPVYFPENFHLTELLSLVHINTRMNQVKEDYAYKSIVSIVKEISIHTCLFVQAEFINFWQHPTHASISTTYKNPEVVELLK